ncbi:MAG: hypothetical protein WC455_11340 [Dehalococcoidia bacterium]|jgi:hypothetical protein
MAAPTATERSTPGGLKLKDGFSSKLTLAADSDIEFFEKTVQPPGMDAGEAIETTTMHNTTYRTFTARKLITLTQITINAAYDPAVYTSIVAIIGDETTITVEFADGTTIAFYGFLKSFTPEAMEEGTMPMAAIVIVPTNVDSTGAEQGPTVTSVTGT